MEEEVIWKDIPGFEGKYQASSLGEIRSCDRKIGELGSKVNRKGVVLRPNTDRDGYLYVGLCVDGKVKTVKAHRAVAMTFLGPDPERTQVNHKDGNPSNNRVDNLEWASASENMTHSFDALQRKHWNTGRKGGGMSRVPDEHIREIRRLVAEGVSQIVIAKQFNVCRAYVGKVAARKIRPDVE